MSCKAGRTDVCWETGRVPPKDQSQGEEGMGAALSSTQPTFEVQAPWRDQESQMRRTQGQEVTSLVLGGDR